jgi:hypothetical protein
MKREWEQLTCFWRSRGGLQLGDFVLVCVWLPPSVFLLFRWWWRSRLAAWVLPFSDLQGGIWGDGDVNVGFSGFLCLRFLCFFLCIFFLSVLLGFFPLSCSIFFLWFLLASFSSCSRFLFFFSFSVALYLASALFFRFFCEFAFAQLL